MSPAFPPGAWTNSNVHAKTTSANHSLSSLHIVGRNAHRYASNSPGRAPCVIPRNPVPLPEPWRGGLVFEHTDHAGEENTGSARVVVTYTDNRDVCFLGFPIRVARKRRGKKPWIGLGVVSVFLVLAPSPSVREGVASAGVMHACRGATGAARHLAVPGRGLIGCGVVVPRFSS